MISFKEAQKLIEENDSLPKKTEEVFISAALGYVNASDIKSPLELPCYDNSAMDGFILRSEDTLNATAQDPVFLDIRGAIKAGDHLTVTLGKKETYKIMTGASVIRGGNTVIPKEKTAVEGNFLIVREPVTKGGNIRFKGEEIKKSELVLPEGSVINPGTIGFLATMGIKKIQVYKKPKISLIATGNELIAPGNPLRPGKIYDSNTSMVQAALDEMRIRPVFARRLDDKPKIIRRIIDFALRESDIVILMGGVSVGDYDYVKDQLAKAGIETIFWKVSQKPGKPIYFGKKGNKLVFGLPGNPASVFTCFYEYVYPAIRRTMGYRNPYLLSEKLPLKTPLKPDPEKLLFIKSKIEYNGVKTIVPLKHQKSHMISSLCMADSFMVVPCSDKMIEKDESVLVHSLPYALESAGLPV